MDKKILGLHHVTAIAGDPQKNVGFYTGLLGLRLVKQTVNFDDPDTYHLYYGDESGRPGTILTFFPWPEAETGRRGTGQATTVSFVVPPESLGYWVDKFEGNGVVYEPPVTRFGEEEVIVLLDPDGLRVELVGRTEAESIAPWERGPAPAAHAIRGLYGVSLSEEGYEGTASLLIKTLGFRLVEAENNRFRYEIGAGGPGATIDLICMPNGAPGLVSVGTVHHVAWRTPDDDQHKAWREEIVRAGLNVTPIIDRRYFRSIYFREPGGVLFEIATDPPGFTVDETLEELGAHLMLPPWLEHKRSVVEQILPALRTPQISYV
ncbi:MAG: ring-cleaving dioxygenase [Armatimonadetes bacterium]|nr:ring-cleaving dioxygenase [Armatimonadota bacterium]